MLLSYNRINIPPADIELASTGRLDGTPTMWTIVNALFNKWKISFKVSRYEAKYSSIDHLIEFLKDLLDHNTPCYFLANYHAIVVQGYDNTTRRIYCIDPIHPNDVLVFTYLEFMNYIRNSAEYKKSKSILIAHKPSQLNNFYYIQNQTFIYKGVAK
jgi:hypothetical protein